MFSKPVITLITRDGNSRVLADLSSYATAVCGILCENEAIFVVCYNNKLDVRNDYKGYLVIKLSLNGEVEGIYYTEKKLDTINQIISLNGQIYVFRSYDSSMLPLKGEKISSRKANKVSTYECNSASVSVDNFGNLIMGSNKAIFIIHPSLEVMHRIETDLDELVTSTAVDKNNQLWLGTASGRLYSCQYLR
jgi:ligand-binding sensor domain-containing protein